VHESNGGTELGQEVAADMTRTPEQPRLLSMTTRQPKPAER
jgi:hypothetical protein